MHFSSAILLATLLPSAFAAFSSKIVYGPYGDVDGTLYDPAPTVKQASKILSVICRWDKRLDYLRLVIAEDGKSSNTVLEYGDISQGKYQQHEGVADDNDQITSLVPYICSDGKAKGLVCGLRIGFENQNKKMLCGHDTTEGHAVIPNSDDFTGYGATKSMKIYEKLLHTFFVVHRKDKVIAKIGWTLKNK